MNQIPIIEEYARLRKISYPDSLQVFMQVITLRNLTLESARLFGGTALTLGFGNPRFSEDIDLTNIPDPKRLRPTLEKGARELAGWFQNPLSVSPPKPGKSTWKLTIQFGPSESVRLHVDSQRYPAHTHSVIVVEYPSIPPFVVASVDLAEILAEKVIAVAFRHYLGGRDLFDLWFHWLRHSASDLTAEVQDLVRKKLLDRKIDPSKLVERLKIRLVGYPTLERAKEEWDRYLPPPFQKPALYQEIVDRSQILVSYFE